MTETYAGEARADDIDTPETPSAALDREADALLREAEGRTFDAPPLRRAVRDDAAAVRDWGRARAGRLRSAVTETPLKATAYALGIGVVIGLLAAR